jgi:hypothetical protein
MIRAKMCALLVLWYPKLNRISILPIHRIEYPQAPSNHRFTTLLFEQMSRLVMEKSSMNFKTIQFAYHAHLEMLPRLSVTGPLRKSEIATLL